MLTKPPIIVLGANGLIGNALAMDLQGRGFAVGGQARRFTTAQVTALDAVVETSLLTLDNKALALLVEKAQIVVNCVGVLQGAESEAVHHTFVARLAAVCATQPQKLLVHVSIPGEERDDHTAFSRSKREGERAIAASGAPFVILRPGFVIASAAYGGSALIRALAALPFALPARESRFKFTATAVSDLCATVAWLAAAWRDGKKEWREAWDVMEEAPGTVGNIIAAFRRHNGGPAPWLSMPGWALWPGTIVGDFVSLLGWKPPVRSTAMAEMRRGVSGNPQAWMAATGITPRSAFQAVAATPATVQEKWFARLYLLKALALTTLVIFWCVSGLIALTASFAAARQILLDHGLSFALAHGISVASSLLDIAVGALIAVRRTSRFGLIAGILVSLGYMAGAAVLTPDLWIEPLGALVKTGPAIVLMLVCLALLDDR
jgi:uncharacterized protein YbjT (DUF2867 family)